MAWSIFFSPPGLPAVEITPFFTQNQSPLVQIFGLPSIGEASVVPSRKADLRLIVDLANNYVNDKNASESIVLDGESTRISLDARYGIAKNFEVGLVIPYIIEGGGVLDGFIDWYHTTFGFPAGGRDQAPKNRLLYQYQKDRQERLKVDQSSDGIGDIQFTGAFQLFRNTQKPSRALSLRAALKLPTGNSDHLHGSGSTDFSLWVSGGDEYTISVGHFSFWGAAGVLGMTQGDVLKEQQRNGAAFGCLGVGWSPARWIAFKIQANGHTAFYEDSDLATLSGNSIQLTIGGTLAFSDKISLDLGLTEDVVVKTSPDVVFHLALRGTF
ncbi:MAG: DUF3187 family protein [Syntrophaceae bacterium]|nr:DUF3187 family protein [Syntrophaceae bacterium]